MSHVRRRKSNPRLSKGFTLLEIILTLAILSILLSLGFVGLQNYRQRILHQQTTQQIVQDILQARSDARRVSADQEVSWTKTRFMSKDLPSGYSLSPESGSFNYEAPHARAVIPDDLLTDDETMVLTIKGRGKRSSSILVFGVTGNVKAVMN